MERLTGRNSDGGAFYKNCFREDTCAGIGCSEKCDHCKHSYNACEKLAVYEDAEEQGLLIRLPCKVGDDVWTIMCGMTGKHPALFRQEFTLSMFSHFGTAVFLTKEEAEAALERMSEKENENE